MTETQTFDWFIMCETCKRETKVDVPKTSAPKEIVLLDVELKRRGWVYKDGKDYCPDCKEETA